MSNIRSRKNLFVWGVIICLHLVFFVLQCFQGNWYLTDSQEYVTEASNIVRDGSLMKK